MDVATLEELMKLNPAFIVPEDDKVLECLSAHQNSSKDTLDPHAPAEAK